MKQKPSQNHFTQVGDTTECGHCHPEKYAISSVIECECICHSSRPVESWEENLARFITDMNQALTDLPSIHPPQIIMIEKFISGVLSQKSKEVEKKISTLKIPTYYGEPYGAGDKFVNDDLDKALEIVKEVVK
jgi:hypothetical protein